jgi:hypothetical protein
VLVGIKEKPKIHEALARTTLGTGILVLPRIRQGLNKKSGKIAIIASNGLSRPIFFSIIYML